MNHLKGLKIFETCVLVNNNLCEKSVLSFEFPVKFDERLKVTSVPFFIADFNFLSCEVDNFTFNVIYWVVYIKIILKWNEIIIL